MDLTKNPFLAAYLAESRSSKTLNVTVVFGILEVLFVGLFLTSKYKSKTFKGIDTYMMIPAFATCFSIIVVNLGKLRWPKALCTPIPCPNQLHNARRRRLSRDCSSG